MAAKLFLKATKLPNDDLALTNKVYLSPEDAKKLKTGTSDLGQFCEVKGFVFTFDEHKGIANGFIGFSSIQRRFVQLSLNEPLEITAFVPKLETIYLSRTVVDVDFLVKAKKTNDEYKAEDLTAVFMRNFTNQFFSVGQKLVAEVNGVHLEFSVKICETVKLSSLLNGEQVSSTKSERGILHTNTVIDYEKAPGSAIRLIAGDGSGSGNMLFKPEFNFSQMGIGGLDEEFSSIFRRAFASRVLPPSVIKKLGIRHVKGLLLYGPPGTGKTLMARQIGKMLNGKEPKVVNGPEILNKYVGQSEENIRNLFADAEKEQKEKGDQSELHIIIFDEIDAICKQRGSRNDGTGVADTVVNQLLAKIDGVESLNNILVIGMTNRKDLIDEALLRPGRLEVHMEISLPDENGRIQILNIHTRMMRDNNMLDTDVSIKELAKDTKNFSGAEIEGLVKSASSWALQRQIDVKDGIKVKPGDIKIGKVDFERALQEIKPLFGVDTDEFENCMRNGIINYGESIQRLLTTGDTFVAQVRNSDRTPLVSVLLEGPPGSGKTALAVRLAKGSKYPYIKLVSPELLVGYSETGKCNKITKIFEDAYRSPLSCIVVDDLERLLDYVRIGPRFSNMILQTLLVLLKKEPPKGRRLLILTTSSNKRVLEEMEFMECFNAALKVPQVSTEQEFKAVLEELQIFTDQELSVAAKSFTAPVSIKKLIMICEMAKQGDRAYLVNRFTQFVQDSALSTV